MLKLFVMAFLVMCCGTVESAEVCVTIDTTGWTNRQKTWREGTAYYLAVQAGQDVVPTLTGEALCFTNPTFDVPTVITATTLLNKMAQQEGQNATETTQMQTDQQELETLTSGLVADDTAWVSLTTAQKLAVAKKLLRREVLKQRLGQ